MYATYDKKKNTVLVEMTPQELALQVVVNGSTSQDFVLDRSTHGDQGVSRNMLSGGHGMNKCGCYRVLRDIKEHVQKEGGYAK